ncbi:MAG: DUF169 domain-containing protein [Chloroflexi bacterium]|nr:DUF169 domain-containing protein [Chloroflexota bacterium]MBU1751497.1 DUF169 domain-containing protein [Chloroflexota bacterium]
MDWSLKRHFDERWPRYFPGTEWPLAFYYTSQPDRAERAQPPTGHHCFIGQLAAVRRGQSLCFDAPAVGCGGGRRYLGFAPELSPRFEYFLSCGIPGELEGERYKQSPELVREFLHQQPSFVAPEPYVVFKRWDQLDPDDEPAVVVFFAPPDVLAGLFTLANFDAADPQAVIAPFGAGCATIVSYPYQELPAAQPRAVLGLFDVSARPYVAPGELTLSIPWPKFARMVGYMDDSFLITRSWQHVRDRIRRLPAAGGGHP